jgi:hypothetical protein
MTPDTTPLAKMSSARQHRLMESRFVRWLLLVVGWLSVAGGIIGLFVPLIPTVPLLLLAAACFARSSERFHQWLLEHNRLGPLVRDYLGGSGIPRRAKLTAIAMVWISVPASAYFVPVPWVRILLLAIAVGVTLYLLRLPIRELQDGENR